MVSNALQNRIKIFTALPFNKIDKMKIQEEIDTIGKSS
jgi:hypothetical protein